jgi:superfamily II DNA/RNA helicase
MLPFSLYENFNLKRMRKLNLDELLNLVYQSNHISLENDMRNIERELQRRALSQTADLIEQKMIGVKSFPNKFDLLDYAISLAPVEGSSLVYIKVKQLTLFHNV